MYIRVGIREILSEKNNDISTIIYDCWFKDKDWSTELLLVEFLINDQKYVGLFFYR